MDVYSRRREKLKELLTKMSQAELSRLSEVSASYINRCLKDPTERGHKTIGEVTARKLEQGAKKPEGWMDATVNITGSQATSAAGKVNATGSNQPLSSIDAARSATEIIDIENNPDYPAIRRVNIKAQAGVTGFAVEYIDRELPPIFFRREWYDSRGYKPERMIAVKVTGESMIPSLHAGDLIVVNMDQKQPKQGVAFLVSFEGEVVVKRLVRDDGIWWLSSDNPDQRRYPRVKCNGGTEIIGEVVYRQTELV